MAVSIHRTGLLDWTTGLTQNGVKFLFQPFSVYIGEKLIMLIQPTSLLKLQQWALTIVTDDVKLFSMLHQRLEFAFYLK